MKPSVFFRLKTCRLLLRAVAGIFDFSWNKHIVEPQYNEPLYNEVLGITNDILYPSTVEPRYNEPLCNEVLGLTNVFLYLSNSKVYEKEPRYNETSV